MSRKQGHYVDALHGSDDESYSSDTEPENCLFSDSCRVHIVLRHTEVNGRAGDLPGGKTLLSGLKNQDRSTRVQGPCPAERELSEMLDQEAVQVLAQFQFLRLAEL